MDFSESLRAVNKGYYENRRQANEQRLLSYLKDGVPEANLIIMAVESEGFDEVGQLLIEVWNRWPKLSYRLNDRSRMGDVGEGREIPSIKVPVKDVQGENQADFFAALAVPVEAESPQIAPRWTLLDKAVEIIGLIDWPELANEEIFRKSHPQTPGDKKPETQTSKVQKIIEELFAEGVEIGISMNIGEEWCPVDKVNYVFRPNSLRDLKVKVCYDNGIKIKLGGYECRSFYQMKNHIMVEILKAEAEGRPPFFPPHSSQEYILGEDRHNEASDLVAGEIDLAELQPVEFQTKT